MRQEISRQLMASLRTEQVQQVLGRSGRPNKCRAIILSPAFRSHCHRITSDSVLDAYYHSLVHQPAALLAVNHELM